MSLILKSPSQIQKELSSRFKMLRLKSNLRRTTLAERSGVPEPTIKKFETDGEISLKSFVKLAFALDKAGGFETFFQPEEFLSLAQIEEQMQKRLDRKRARK